jgi:hypothetical protein
MRKAIFSSLVLILLPLIVFSYTLYTPFDEMSFDMEKGYDIPFIEGATSSILVGAPMLPVKSVMLSIPSGMEIESVDITYSEPYVLSGEYEVFPAQTPQKVSEFTQDYEFMPPDPEYYNISGEYPG